MFNQKRSNLLEVTGDEEDEEDEEEDHEGFCLSDEHRRRKGTFINDVTQRGVI